MGCIVLGVLSQHHPKNDINCKTFLGSTSVVLLQIILLIRDIIKGKAVPLQAWTGLEGSRKLRLPDFVTTAQDGGRLSALCTGRFYPQEILLVLISVRS